jgi:hypothetical protein
MWGRRGRQLPTTSYGFTPPSGAEARNWECINREECGRVGNGAPTRWPHACDGCGGPTDPVLAEPWAHDARGVEIQYLLASGVEDGGFTALQWPIWRHKDALIDERHGDAAAARAEYRAIVEQQECDYPGRGSMGYWSLAGDALRAGQPDGAVEILDPWLRQTRTEEVESDSTQRANACRAVDAALDFLESPAGEPHPATEVIRQRCLSLAAEIHPVLSADLQARILRQSRLGA